MSITNEPETSPETSQEELEKFALGLQNVIQTIHSGAHWFYWIAVLSLINSLVFHFGWNWSFFMGLAATQNSGRYFTSNRRRANARFYYI